MHFTSFDIVLFVILLISLSVFYERPTPLYLKLFPAYFISALIVVLRSEWLARHGRYNTGLGNVWGIIEFCFYFFVLYEIIENSKFRKIIFYIAVAFVLFASFNLIFQHKIAFNPINFTVGCLITVLSCIYYYIELFRKVEARSLSRSSEFWICTGIFFNTVLSFPTFALESFLEESSKVSKATYLLYRNMDSILIITIILTFLLYAIGFLCRIRIRKTV